ncbi:hypothetical protein L211DRAFT_867611 [Terfezia boudieri ATCC MYA-4762]|uniref:C2H2-type domain-containing protein n=1 Tax=Terfezia boudieri ATCC MYA-4762 TaxID=1051890 RepID=A0A3N4LPA1_9PEZI|nr:hypothetical protein L211DRAFT_867611 [Terfezia boudieri ATCC MYA-4762]
MSSDDNLDEFHFEMAKDWCLEPIYGQEDNFIRDDGQIQGQSNSAFNFSFEPDEVPDLELQPTIPACNSAFTKRHTMPESGIYSTSPNSHHARPTHPSPKRAETLPSTIEVSNIARNKKRIAGLLSKIEPAPSSERGNEPFLDRNVAQSPQVNPMIDMECEEWPVPTFFLDQIGPPPALELDRADDLTPEDPEGSPKCFGNTQSNNIDDNKFNNNMPEVLHSVLHLGPYVKVTPSDSGIGSSTKSYGPGPTSVVESLYRHTSSNKGGRSSWASQAKGFDRASVSASTPAGRYQQVVAKLGPLTSAASSTTGCVETPRILSETALKTMKTIILEPILNNSKFCDFWDICRMAGEQMESGQIGSLRDLEKFLFHKASNIKNNEAYINFCKEFLHHVRESLKYMPQNELLRPYDRPYDTGYFLDTLAPFDKSTMQFEFEEDPAIGEWLGSMASQPPQSSQPLQLSQSGKRVTEADIAGDSLAKRPKPNRPGLRVDTNNYLSEDWLDSEMTPISGNPGAMGPPPVPRTRMKSTSPIQYPRNKTKHQGRAQQVKEPQAFPCTWDGCAHQPFPRACDLTVESCKYAIEGFPTEKERDRHWTDRHSPDTPAFCCKYFPCTYKSKRESNCKQHMENAHGYTYVRMKQNHKASGDKRQSHSPTSPGDQESPMGAPPSYQATAQASIGDGFPQTKHQNQYTDRDLAALQGILIRSFSDSFGHQAYMTQGPTEQLPYPPDVTNPSTWVYTPMPVPPIPDDYENIDPNLEMNVNVGGGM